MNILKTVNRFNPGGLALTTIKLIMLQMDIGLHIKIHNQLQLKMEFKFY